MEITLQMSTPDTQKQWWDQRQQMLGRGAYLLLFFKGLYVWIQDQSIFWAENSMCTNGVWI